MRTVSGIEVLLSISEAQRVGELHRSLSGSAHALSTTMSQQVEVSRAQALLGLGVTGAARRAAWDKVLAATAGLLAPHEMLASLSGLDRRASQVFGQASTAVGDLVQMQQLDLPDAMVPPALRGQLSTPPAGGTDAERFTRSLLGPATPVQADAMASGIRVLTHLRLRALHAAVLGRVRDATPDSDAASDADLASLATETSAHVRTLRDHAHSAATDLKTGSATPALALGLWAALFGFETWLVDEAAGRMADVAATATARVDAGTDSSAERWARSAAKIYDGLRHGLAFDAGVRAVLLAYARGDLPALDAFARTRELPDGPAASDHPHSSLAGVAALPPGAPVEIAGLVSKAEFRLGGPSNRSVLTLGQSGTVRVLVPHVSVDSFGVAQGAWLQVRGTAFPAGKDDLTGPVVMAGRVAGADAARQSFSDALIFSGRHSFVLRPGGLDLVAGRQAGRLVSMNEISRPNQDL